MIKHIVMFKLKKDRLDELHELRKRLDNLQNTIDVIKYFETGVNIRQSSSAYDLVLISEFESLDDLEKYRVHPDHQKVMEYIAIVKESSIVVDYKF
ncbi:MAG: Dabb family protein [Bacteroidales bacterium]|nr:Dabb family protein [Bacteroidales bacterium]